MNIAEILKDAPKGTTLWSPLCGNCELICIGGEKDWIYCKCIEEIKEDVHFDKEGKFFSNDNAECVLFPSENNRDWSTFKAPWKHKHFEPFQKVLVVCQNSDGEDIWMADIYSHYRKGLHYTSHYRKGLHYTTIADGLTDDKILAYEGNEDKLGKSIE